MLLMDMDILFVNFCVVLFVYRKHRLILHEKGGILSQKGMQEKFYRYYFEATNRLIL